MIKFNPVSLDILPRFEQSSPIATRSHTVWEVLYISLPAAKTHTPTRLAYFGAILAQAGSNTHLLWLELQVPVELSTVKMMRDLQIAWKKAMAEAENTRFMVHVWANDVVANRFARFLGFTFAQEFGKFNLYLQGKN